MESSIIKYKVGLHWPGSKHFPEFAVLGRQKNTLNSRDSSCKILIPLWGLLSWLDYEWCILCSTAANSGNTFLQNIFVVAWLHAVLVCVRQPPTWRLCCLSVLWVTSWPKSVSDKGMWCVMTEFHSVLALKYSSISYLYLINRRTEL